MNRREFLKLTAAGVATVAAGPVLALTNQPALDGTLVDIRELLRKAFFEALDEAAYIELLQGPSPELIVNHDMTVRFNPDRFMFTTADHGQAQLSSAPEGIVWDF